MACSRFFLHIPVAQNAMVDQIYGQHLSRTKPSFFQNAIFFKFNDTGF